MVLKSLYLLPHGGVIVPDLEPNRPRSSETLHNAMLNINREIKKDEIDLIFLNSPHSYLHPTDYLVYYHQLFEGQQIFRGDKLEHPEMRNYLFKGNIELSQKLIEVMRQNQIPASPLIQAEPNHPVKLSWGEVIPLSYIASYDEGPEVIIFSTPMAPGLSRGGDEHAIPELFEVGQIIDEIANNLDLNVAFVASGDLSHKHDPNHEYGYHDDAEIFDQKAKKWAENMDNDTLIEMYKLQETAESCGIVGMNILQGIFEKQNGWRVQNSIYECPTYFGMQVTKWSK